MWRPLAADGEWTQKEVALPLPANLDTTTTAFSTDMVFAIAPDSLRWLTFWKGSCSTTTATEVPLYPFPELYAVVELRLMCRRLQEEYHHSMCCGQILCFFSLDGYTQGLPVGEEVILRTWALHHPWSRTKLRWELLHSFCVVDLWLEPPVYKMLKRPLKPSHPVISTQQPHVIYLLVQNYEKRYEHTTGCYVLSVDNGS